MLLHIGNSPSVTLNPTFQSLGFVVHGLNGDRAALPVTMELGMGIYGPQQFSLSSSWEFGWGDSAMQSHGVRVGGLTWCPGIPPIPNV